MSGEDPFLLLIQRVRAGDQEAAAELVRQYELAIRRAVRFQLRDSRLRRALDSMDVCQSVLGSFFARAALGQFEIDKPEQVLRLLITMARNKLATQARKPHIRRQEQHGLEPGLRPNRFRRTSRRAARPPVAICSWSSANACRTRSASWPISGPRAANGPRSPQRGAKAPKHCLSAWPAPWIA
jgi:DNA-directed RNA polymerase specialized sigma24 family protein